MHMEASVFLQPPLYPLMFVRGVVVADDVDLLFAGHGLVDQVQELQPLVMAMALPAEMADPPLSVCIVYVQVVRTAQTMMTLAAKLNQRGKQTKPAKCEEVHE